MMTSIRERAMFSLQQYVQERQRRANSGSRAWSSSYHAAFGIAGVLGIAISLIVHTTPGSKFWNIDRDMWISILAAVASVPTFIGGFGGFERKWRSNRLMRAEMDKLLIDLWSASPDLADIRGRLFTAIDRHEAAIPGEMGAGIKMVDDLQYRSDTKTTADAKKAEQAKKAAE